jgi:hypothetical protein
MMDNSYLKQATTLTILVIEVKSAATPKASGAKSLATIGANRIPIPWATTLPDVSFRTLPANVVECLDKKFPLTPF